MLDTPAASFPALTFQFKWFGRRRLASPKGICCVCGVKTGPAALLAETPEGTIFRAMARAMGGRQTHECALRRDEEEKKR